MRSQEFGWLTSPSCAHNFTQVFMYQMLTFSKRWSFKGMKALLQFLLKTLFFCSGTMLVKTLHKEYRHDHDGDTYLCNFLNLTHRLKRSGSTIWIGGLYIWSNIYDTNKNIEGISYATQNKKYINAGLVIGLDKEPKQLSSKPYVSFIIVDFSV